MVVLETWRPVVGFEGYYEVSDLGRVRSTDRMVTNPHKNGLRRVRGRVLRAKPTKPTDYPMVSLWREGVQHSRRVHKLVAEAFLGPCPPGLEVCHKDDDKHRNQLSNLRYDTRSGNQLDKVRLGTCNFYRGTCALGHPIEPPNRTSAGGCKSCHRARGTVRYMANKDVTIDFTQEADAAYQRILAGTRRR